LNEKRYWVWLSCIPGIGARRFYKLLEFFDSPAEIFRATDAELKHAELIIGKKNIEILRNYKSEKYLKQADAILLNQNIRVITLLCKEYPPLLKTIYDPPPVIYVMGQELKTNLPTIAIVGSRRSSEYGRITARNISRTLAEAGVVIISGMARGIDSMAHAGALDAENGYTIAVLGCGVDYIYPLENKRLYYSILERGTIISEYPPGTSPAPGNFPARNRIVSGMSHGILVVEAGIKSGALITVDCALEQGRDVYALPGNINSPLSQGTNKLLKEGAKIVTSVEDIIEDLKNASLLQSQSILPFHRPDSSTQVLDLFESLVYNALEDGEKGFEDLVLLTKIEPGQLNGILTLMEIKGVIKKLPGKIFSIQWKV
jgi:DNA processing protein